MKGKELFECFGLLLRAEGKEQPDRMTRVLGLAKKLQALTDENECLERYLVDRLLHNRGLQSIRSKRAGFKF